MDNRERFKKLIYSKYDTLESFAKAINIPAPTIHHLLNNGFEKTSFINVIKIARELDLDINYMSEGVLIKKSDVNYDIYNGLNSDEITELNKYREYLLFKRDEK